MYSYKATDPCGQCVCLHRKRSGVQFLAGLWGFLPLEKVLYSNVVFILI